MYVKIPVSFFWNMSIMTFFEELNIINEIAKEQNHGK